MEQEGECSARKRKYKKSTAEEDEMFMSAEFIECYLKVGEEYSRRGQQSHKTAAKYQNKRLPYFEDRKDSAIGKDAENSCQSMTPTASNGSTRLVEGSNKRKRRSSNETEADLVRIAEDLTPKLADENKEVTIHLLHDKKELADGLTANQLSSEKSMKLWGELTKIYGLSVAEKVAALVKILANPNTMLLAFFTIPAELKDMWVKVLLAE